MRINVKTSIGKWKGYEMKTKKIDFGSTVDADGSRTLSEYRKIMTEYPIISKCEISHLSYIYHRHKNAKNESGKERSRMAHQKIVFHNIRIAFHYASIYVNFGIDFTDLVQWGMIGLDIAAKRYYPQKKASFYTYAHWWVWQRILRAIENSSQTIRIPTSRRREIRKIIIITGKLEGKLGRIPTTIEIAKFLKKSPEDVEKLLNIQKLSNSISLDTPLNDELDGSVLSDVLVDEKAENPTEVIDKNFDTSTVRKLLEKLKPRERKVIELRFGLHDGGKGMTLDDIGYKFKVTREMIRQIEAKALRKLRKPSCMIFFKPKEEQFRDWKEVQKTRDKKLKNSFHE
ncbi:MAG TPA: RNA polymerase sigma factor RpoD/SigA [Candidatus Paceibacterota bacterium]